MRYFPINIDIQDKLVTIVGGGSVATRKCLRVIEAGALVTVISPHLNSFLRELATSGHINHIERKYASGDLASTFLVFAATDDPTTNHNVAEDARQMGILADITDAPELGNFISTAMMNRGELLLTVSTGGRAPALARKIRETLETQFGQEYAEVIDLHGRVREKLLTRKADNTYNKHILSTLAGHDLSTLFRNHAFKEIDHLLLSLCGSGFTLAELGVSEKDSA